MAELLHRVAPPDLEVRGDGRTIIGIAVPFDRETAIREGFDEYVEVFRRGAFSRTIEQAAHKVKFLAQHDARRLPLGAASLLREDAAGLYIEARVSATRDGDEALELVRDHALDALSVGFTPVRDRPSGAGSRRLVERLEVKLREVSLVAFPAYEDARVLAVRADGSPYGPPPTTVDVAKRRLDLLRMKASQ